MSLYLLYEVGIRLTSVMIRLSDAEHIQIRSVDNKYLHSISSIRFDIINAASSSGVLISGTTTSAVDL